MSQLNHPDRHEHKSEPATGSINLAIVNLLYWLVKSGMRLEVSDSTRQSFDELDNALLKTSAVLYIYHSQLTDALVLPLALRSQLNNLEKLLGPVAISHYQGWQKLYLDLIGKLTGSIPLPVIRKKDEKKFSPTEKTKLLRQLTTTTDRFLNSPGSIYGIAPMGTRANQLNAATVNSSFVKVAQSKRLPLIPMAIIHEDNKTTFTSGDLLPPPPEHEDLNDLTHYFMSQLALLLPQKLRGDYS